MFETFKKWFGRREPVRPTPSRAQPVPRWDPPARAVPPPPPPPPPPKVGAEEETPDSEPSRPRIKVRLEDGTYAPLDDPDIREQMERIANQILPNRDPG